MQESSNLLEGVTTRETNIESHRGRNFTIPQSIAEEHQQQPIDEDIKETGTTESSAAAFIDSVKKFFAPCVGVVDAASLYIGECRPSNFDTFDPNEKGENVAEDVIMKLRERNGGFKQQAVKRRSETLEIPTHGMLFDDDDVSAISSHTLEEMERLRMAQNSRLSNFQMSPNINHNRIMRPKAGNQLSGQKSGAQSTVSSNNQNWEIKKSPVTNESAVATNELSICVSASDSSSSEGVEQKKDDISRTQSTPPSWGSEVEKHEGFKTHRVG